MLIKNNEHIFICGMTQSGKTYFAGSLYRAFKPGHIIIFDVKYEITLPNAIIVYSADEKKISSILDSGKNVIVRTEGQANFDRIAELILARGNTVGWIDEGADVVPEFGLTESFRKIYSRGASRGSVLWTLTQRPKFVSKTAIAQSKHSFIFATVLFIDKKTICSNIPVRMEDFEKLKNYNFLHYCQGDTCAKLCRPI